MQFYAALKLDAQFQNHDPSLPLMEMMMWRIYLVAAARGVSETCFHYGIGFFDYDVFKVG